MIENDFFSFSKKVKDIEFFEDIRRIIYSLNYTKDEKINTKEDRADFGYLSRRLNSQFLGYLLVDLQKSQFQETNSQIIKYGLDEDERKIIEKYHQLTLELNKKAIRPVLDKNSSIYDIINPYNKFKYGPPPINRLTQKDLEFIENNAIEFKDHPSLLFLKDIEIIFQDSEKILQLVLSFESEIYRTGIEKAPKKFIEIIEKSKKNNQLFLVIALLSLRASLEIYDQLFFQAVVNDKLIYLDENNTISYAGPFNNDIGLGYDITHQFIIGIEPGEIFLFNDLISGQNKQLCRTEYQAFEISDEIGSISRLKARFIDENLDPYCNLSKKLIL